MVKYLIALALIVEVSCTYRRVVICAQPFRTDVELTMNGDSFVPIKISAVNPDDSLFNNSYIATLDSSTFLSMIDTLEKSINLSNAGVGKVPVCLAFYTKANVRELSMDSLSGVLIILEDTININMHSFLYGKGQEGTLSEINGFNNIGYYFSLTDLQLISTHVFDGANWAFFALHRMSNPSGPKKIGPFKRSVFHTPLRKYKT